MKRNRIFTVNYQSVNGIVNFKKGDFALITRFLGVTDVEIVVNNQVYTLPIDDFMNTTTELDQFIGVKYGIALRKEMIKLTAAQQSMQLTAATLRKTGTKSKAVKAIKSRRN